MQGAVSAFGNGSPLVAGGLPYVEVPTIERDVIFKGRPMAVCTTGAEVLVLHSFSSAATGVLLFTLVSADLANKNALKESE